jgi:DNA-binding CsgD family transcriptional regulator
MFRPIHDRIAAVSLLSVLFLVSFPAQAQEDDAMLNKKYAERATWLWKKGDEIHYQPDSSGAFKLSDQLRTTAQRAGDKALELEAELYRVFYLFRYHSKDNDQRIVNELDAVRKAAIKAGCVEEEAKAIDLLASFYWSIGQYELALRNYRELERVMQPLTVASFPDKMQMLFHIGNAYFFFRDYRTAITYFTQVPEIRKPHGTLQLYSYRHSLNNLGVCYRALSQLDSSDYYFYKLQEYNRLLPDGIWNGIVSCGLGYNAYLRSEDDKAIRLLQTGVDEALKAGDYNLAARCQLPLASIYFRQKNPLAAGSLDSAQHYTVMAGSPPDLLQDLYPLLARRYAALGNAELSGRYLDSSLLVRDSLHRQFSGLMMARAVQKDALAQQKEKLDEVERKKQTLTFRFYIALACLTLLLIIGLYLYRSRQLRYRQEKIVRDLQLAEAEKELIAAKQQLDDFARHIGEKNQLIEAMENQYGPSSLVEELEKSIILTGADWGRFRESFEKVHRGYLQRLNDKIPGITPAEIRLMALARLNLSPKEMAAALGITPQAIRVTWHRLRKKAGLPDDLRMEDLAAGI